MNNNTSKYEEMDNSKVVDGLQLTAGQVLFYRIFTRRCSILFIMSAQILACSVPRVKHHSMSLTMHSLTIERLPTRYGIGYHS